PIAVLPLLFANDPAPPYIYPLSLHDALPICIQRPVRLRGVGHDLPRPGRGVGGYRAACMAQDCDRAAGMVAGGAELDQCLPPRRSEEHTSELQSLTNLVCRLLLEKKKIKYIHPTNYIVVVAVYARSPECVIISRLLRQRGDQARRAAKLCRTVLTRDQSATDGCRC